MGNYRFRLSDMMPNAWFYKLKDMSYRAKKKHCTPHSTGTSGEASRAAATTTAKPLQSELAPNRTSCYYSSRRTEADRFAFSPTQSKAVDTHFPLESPRKSKRRSRRKPIRPPVVKPKLVTSPVSAGCSCRAWKADSMMPADFSAVPSPETPPCQRDYCIDGENLPFHKINLDDQQFEYDDLASWPRYCSCRLTSLATDIIIDMGSTDNSIARKLEKLGEFDSASEPKLPPIITKPASQESEGTEFEDKNVVDHKVSLSKEQVNKSQGNNKPFSGLQRLRTRANSPRLASRKVQARRSRKSMQQRKSLSASFAVVKSSSDPQRDFRDSMLEMIVENNIRTSNDLEELLACYLSLNSNEYHDVIVKVFEQIWFDLTNIKS